MHYIIPESESRQARLPHELFLINLVTNHILLFVGLLGMFKGYPLLALVTPAISFLVLGYLLFRAKKERQNPSWFVMCHWQLCARRSRFFVGMILAVLLVVILLVLSAGGDIALLRPGHYAIGGIAFLPGMFSILVLIVMESDGMHQAKTGRLPVSLLAIYPEPKSIKKQESF
ncbi:MAG: hypothetical protein GXP22_09050 [Gammaproteobacteria bacterium]|nr:hypothetical protein [Gammaproteobacteria bacterium]